MKYIVLHTIKGCKQAMRLGHTVVEAFGPFDTLDEANNFIEELIPPTRGIYEIIDCLPIEK